MKCNWSAEKLQHNPRSVTAAAFLILLSRSYAEYHTTTPDNEKFGFGEWCKPMPY